MAYKQKGCTPVTAKIKRTTQGGMVQQPLLNMGAPVKMKMTSPAKVDGGGYRNISYKEYRESGKMDPNEAKFYKGSGTKRVKSSDFPVAKKETTRREPKYTDMSFAEYRKSGLMKPEDAKYYKGGGTKRVKTKKEVKPVQEVETKPVPVVETKPAPVVETKPKQKMAKSGTASRKAQYDAKGWKYDETISGYNKAGRKVQKAVSSQDKPKAKLAEVKAPKISVKNVAIATKAPSSKKEARQAKRASNKSSREEIRSTRKAYRKGDITKKQKKEAIGTKKNSMAKKMKSC